MYRYLIGIVLLFTTINISGQEEKSLQSHLIKKWAPEKIISTDDSLKDSFSMEDHLSFILRENEFTRFFSADSITAKGEWNLSDSVLQLTYDLKPIEKEIDSTVYRVVNDKPELIYYHDGRELTKFSEIKLESIRETISYNVLLCSADSLVLSENGNTLIFKAKEAKIASEGDSGFGFTSLYRGIIGILTVLVLAYIFSVNRRAISWRIVSVGLAVQLVIAVAVLKVPFIQSMIEFIGKIFIKVLAFTKVGSEFIFGGLLDTESFGVIFAFQILPTILFFSALTSILFYYGIIQKIVYGLAWLLTKALKISGAESLSAAGNIFLGQTESPLLIKEYLKKMNRSEIMLVMVGGMATIAGGVLAIYIGLLGGNDPAEQLLFAKHLITASVMAAPGAIVAAKILVPQTEPIESKIEISKENVGSNFLDAIAVGTGQGIKLAVNVGAMLIVFLALIAMVNYILQWVGGWTNLNDWIVSITGGQYEDFSLEFVLGYIFSPIAWAIGVPATDMTLVAQLFGEKIILNEMIAYKSMKELIDVSSFTYQKSVVIATYLLCGFANFGSVGIQIGGIGALAPNKKVLLSRLGFRALVGGAIASMLSATIVGMIIG